MKHGVHGDPELAGVDRLLKALADPTRMRIVGLLNAGEICVCHVHDSLRISQPKTSRHLAYLRRAGVVHAEKRGLWVYYRLAEQSSARAQRMLEAAKECVTGLETTQKDCCRLEKARPDLAPAAAAQRVSRRGGSSAR